MTQNINQLLALEDIRAGRSYYSPTYLMSASTGLYGVPFHINGALSYGQWLPLTVGAPVATPVTTPNIYNAGALQNNMVSGYGQAPTSGIYTGVEDVCS